MKTLTVGSLFSGILGGFDLGFERAGFEIRWQVEIDPWCRAVLAKHWPKAEQYVDIRTLERLEPVDIIVGGDPCQENSRARSVHQRVLAPSLGHEFIRIVEICRPRLVLRENPSRIRADAPWPWWRFRSELERLDYVVLPFRLRTCCFGADGQRDRLFLLAERADAVRPGLEGWHDGRAGAVSLCTEQAGAAGEPVPTVGSLALWLRALGDDLRDRVRFSRRLDRRRIHGLGNSVCPQVAEYIAQQILIASGPAGTGHYDQ